MAYFNVTTCVSVVLVLDTPLIRSVDSNTIYNLRKRHISMKLHVSVLDTYMHCTLGTPLIRSVGATKILYTNSFYGL